MFGIVRQFRFLSSQARRSTIYFTVGDRVGALDDVLSKLRQLNISLSRIESRPSKTKGDYDFYIDFTVTNDKMIQDATSAVKDHCKEVKIVSTGSSDAESPGSSVPWFPRKIGDLDLLCDRVLSYGAELDADHPGFTDQEYRTRRSDITQQALKHRHGQPLPRVEYTKQEIETWGVVFDKLTGMYPTHACYEHQYIFPLLVQNCGYRRDNIPQLDIISKFLKECTGWTIRPVMGLLSARDFLNALAFRVFHSTQYIRHHSKPFYTPEPDICHELLGHVPLYADPDFAAFSQEVGLASLGASDEDLEKLARIYWYTVEFGLTKQKDGIRAYGAGLLSSFGELEYCLTKEPKYAPFDCNEMANTPYPITKYQPLYFVAESFKQMKDEVREFAANLNRPFAVTYNSATETVEVLDSKDKLVRYSSAIKGDLSRLIAALERMQY
ncbi:Biopterin-dependent aromatic amino acid hydroxylase-domain-containing protein [Gorgonomyces haynaldii]|nr:Biopterin-dependent aromatic amino acid hydroxylase-domain-containing protein [Gorgonomyces haynaldii]